MEQLIMSIDHVSIGRYVSVAGSTLWLYDYLLTCESEFTRIWPTKLSLVKVLYMINRYIAIPYLGLTMYYMLGTPAENQAKFEIALISATWLMLTRVRALYSRYRWATWVLYTAFVFTHLLTTGFGAHSVAETYPTLAYLSIIRVCLSGIPTYIKLIYFLQIPFELLLLAMQMMHYWKFSRVIAPVKPAPLLRTLYTDGVLYFIVIICVRMWAGLIVVFLDPTYWYMTVAIDFATTSTLISRIFLHLNEVSTRQKHPSFTNPIASVTPRAKASRVNVQVDSWMEIGPPQRGPLDGLGKN